MPANDKFALRRQSCRAQLSRARRTRSSAAGLGARDERYCGPWCVRAPERGGLRNRRSRVGTGAIWLVCLRCVVTGDAAFVQGGGCTTVGVAGPSKVVWQLLEDRRYRCGFAACAEVVTADGEVRIANACTNRPIWR